MNLYRKSPLFADSAGIRRQAELLAAARHPGVVELVGVEGSADRPVLVTAFVDGPTLAAPLVFTVEEIAGLAGSLATTLADLHELGIVHGSVAPEHVLVRPDGRPVLCGFGAAGMIGEPGPGDHELHPSADVAGLGRLVRRMATGPEARALRRIAEAATADDPAARPSASEVAAELAAAVPEPRLPVRHPGTGHGGAPTHDLRSLVAGARIDRRRRGLRRRRVAATHDAPASVATRPERVAPRRQRSHGVPGAALLGTDIGEWDVGEWDDDDPRSPDRVDEPESDDRDAGRASANGRGDVDPDLTPGAGTRLERPGVGATSEAARRPPPASAPQPRSGRFRVLAGGATVVAVTLLLAASWASPGRPDAPRVLPATSAPTPTPPPTSSVPPASSTPPTARTDCPTPASVLFADIDSDGCPDALHYADGVLEAGGVRWSLGQDGDQLTTGDWSCRGTRTIVLLRPSTGEVFRFDAWAVGTHDSVTAAPVARVPGGQAVRAADVDRDGCHELVVERGELPPQVVQLPRRQP